MPARFVRGLRVRARFRGRPPARDGRGGSFVAAEGLNFGGAAITCTPIAFQGDLLVPLDKGEVHLIDPATGRGKLLPFQPRLEPGEKLTWLRPTVVGSDGREFIIANDRREIFRIGIKDKPKPFLTTLETGLRSALE